MAILVTGGAGYIGSHTCVELLAAGFQPVVVDNLSNSSEEALRRVEFIGGKSIPFYDLDIRDSKGLRKVFSEFEIDAVIHFAGLKAVGESVAQPLRYYQNNVAGTLSLCEVMAEFGVHRLIFSSSATVYGDPETVPIKEDFPTGATNPYGSSKLLVENILGDLCAAPDSLWKVSVLRYFNPIGAHESGTIGEDPSGIPNNLLPYVSQVAVGRLEQLQIFGGDYDTVDGTGVRDYIHVVDLARGHLAALNLLRKAETSEGCYTHNLGTGQGSSVLEVVRAFERVSGREVPYHIAPRRAGDIAECYAAPELAEKELGWKAEYDLVQMVEDTWRWQYQNPKGYSED
ncbi:UDP-glucose 4-epimerase GalE [Microbulbifer sp. OS29]|uniref:UDP-glucose 4-epimerase n=1 Tax=Microbulbifer okhotskensis TaxID=2926617 RepID=A0A9X2EJN3_9GAMM|nr:UDP-glucose 4-epimerase GalE [Microbulbifer okhotskensis]MCO1333467.1 UDP-glucose 4-epimerase GalE [Microbulbifer okhotskensis]